MSEKVSQTENLEVVEEEVLQTEEIAVEELIVIKQLPVIEEQLKNIKANIENKVSKVLALECNESTVKAIKVLRADLKKDFNEFEDRRKIVKNKVMEPYELFDKVYKDCVTSVFNSADAELKNRIDEVELALKANKAAEVENYFEEYRQSKNIEFVTFAMSNIKVTLSASKKSLKEQAKAFLDRISDDLKLIETQEHKEEIFVEYKKTLNVSNSITSVVERHKAIEAEREKQENIMLEQTVEQAVIDKVNAAIAESVPLSAPKTESTEEKPCKMTFTVIHTRQKMKELKAYLIREGFEFIK